MINSSARVKRALKALGLLSAVCALSLSAGCAKSSLEVPAAPHAGLNPQESRAMYASWTAVTDEMQSILDTAAAIYAEGRAKDALDTVNVAYFQYYEKLGVERSVMRYISGRTSRTTEFEFANLRKMINAGADAGEVSAQIDLIKDQLADQGAGLDAKVPQASAD